jgi:ligand-binding sensor domain-containing protein
MRKYPAAYIVLMFILAGIFGASGKTILLDESKGLSHSYVKDITSDKSGLMWVATYSGLNTYDGYIVREVASFKTIQVRCIKYDELNDRLWIGTDRGLWYINTLTRELISCTPFLAQNVVTNIVLNKGVAYIGFWHGAVLRISPQLECKFLYSGSSQGAKHMELEEKNMAVDSSGSLYIHFAGTGTILILNEHMKGVNFLPVRVGKGLTIYNNELTISTSSGKLRTLDIRKWKWKKNTLLDSIGRYYPDPQFVAYGSHGELFVRYGSSSGIYRIGKEIKRIGDKSDQDLFKNRTVNCIYRDIYNVLWVGTSKGLIEVAEPEQEAFGNLLSRFDSPLSIRQITGTPSGDLLIATYSGIFKKSYQHKETMIPIIDPDFPTQSRTLLPDSDFVYIGSESENDFFFRYNLKLHCFEKSFYTMETKGEKITATYSSLRDQNGVLWLATNKGLVSYHPLRRLLILHRDDAFETGTGSLKYIGQSSDSNHIWVAGEQGVWLIDIHKGIQQHFSHITRPGFPENEIIYVGEGPDESIWCGTKGAGLIRIDKSLQHFQILNRSNGLSNNEVYGVLWAGADTAWISTMNGLCCYRVKSGTFMNYFMENGLTDNEFNQNSFYKDPNGYFYFGGMNGITCFDPAALSVTAAPVYLFSSSVSKWDSRVSAFSDIAYNGNQTIEIKPGDHLLSFSFGISDKSEPDYNSYFYRIKGLYNEWVSLGNQNTLRLEGLPAGTFTVQVIGYNKRGTRSTNILEYPIHIIPVFYKTGWFLGLLILFISGTILFYFRWRIKQLNRMQQLRTDIASNLHDEIGGLLTRITMAAENLHLRPQQVEDKTGTLEKITMLSRTVNSNMSDVLWAIDARNDFAGSFSARMRELAEIVFEDRDISFSIDSDEKSEFQKIPPDERQQLFLIYKEAIHNILKHSNAGNVSIVFRYHNSLFLSISNDGVDGKMNYGGQGLKNMEMRATKIGTHFRYSHSGNVFTIEVSGKPLH